MKRKFLLLPAFTVLLSSCGFDGPILSYERETFLSSEGFRFIVNDSGATDYAVLRAFEGEIGSEFLIPAEVAAQGKIYSVKEISWRGIFGKEAKGLGSLSIEGSPIQSEFFYSDMNAVCFPDLETLSVSGTGVSFPLPQIANNGGSGDGMPSLSRIKFGEGVVRLEGSSYDYGKDVLSSLKEITIGPDVEEVEGTAFANTGIESVIVPEGHAYFRAGSGCLYGLDGSLVAVPGHFGDTLVIAAGTPRVSEQAARFNALLETVIVEDSETEIATGAFSQPRRRPFSYFTRYAPNQAWRQIVGSGACPVPSSRVYPQGRWEMRDGQPVATGEPIALVHYGDPE